jgi:hypothetical protein
VPVSPKHFYSLRIFSCPDDAVWLRVKRVDNKYDVDQLDHFIPIASRYPPMLLTQFWQKNSSYAVLDLLDWAEKCTPILTMITWFSWTFSDTQIKLICVVRFMLENNEPSPTTNNALLNAREMHYLFLHNYVVMDIKWQSTKITEYRFMTQLHSCTK